MSTIHSDEVRVSLLQILRLSQHDQKSGEEKSDWGKLQGAEREEWIRGETRRGGMSQDEPPEEEEEGE